MNRYFENIFRYLVTTVMGAALVGVAIYLIIGLVDGQRDPTFLLISLVIVLVGSGAYMLGAEGLITELNKIGVSLFNKEKKP